MRVVVVLKVQIPGEDAVSNPGSSKGGSGNDHVDVFRRGRPTLHRKRTRRTR
jgi:hypothetical protein